MKTVLTVDDASAIRKLIRFALSNEGYQIIEAANGQEALTMTQTKPIDLIIADINMPVMDGLELTRQVRANPRSARTPILLLTTENDPQKKTMGRNAGATGWLVKPFKREQLVEVVKKVLP